jgi:hypothetical protein
VGARGVGHPSCAQAFNIGAAGPAKTCDEAIHDEALDLRACHGLDVRWKERDATSACTVQRIKALSSMTSVA